MAKLTNFKPGRKMSKSEIYLQTNWPASSYSENCNGRSIRSLLVDLPKPRELIISFQDGNITAREFLDHYIRMGQADRREVDRILMKLGRIARSSDSASP
jgi:hypothetical protein